MNWESSEDMMAAKMPAIKRPDSNSLLTSCLTIMARAVFSAGLPSGRSGIFRTPASCRPAAQTPIRTHGTQTMAMQMGCAITVNLNVLADLAVSQCWNRCGNMATLSGMKR